MPVLGRSELRSACCLYGASFWKTPTDLNVELVQEYLFILQNALKHLLKPIFSTVFMDLFLLKSELPCEYLHLPSIKHDKKLPHSTK
jgi:hypothetical protein